MNLRFFVLPALLAAIALSATAQASTVEMGDVFAPQEGLIDSATTCTRGTCLVDAAKGRVGVNSEIRFDYTLTSADHWLTMSQPVIYASSDYNFTGTDGFDYSASVVEQDPGFDISWASANGSNSTPLVLVTANIVDATHGYTTIKNLSSTWVNFFSAILSGSSLTSVTTYYHVTATPLPAALPLFGAGLVALVGLRKRRKTDAAI